jgi:hypothetical protein
MSRRPSAFSVVVTASVMVVIASACLDTSAPDGLSAISTLQLPSPSVVLGDVLRDSAGAPAPVRLVAYDESGAPQSGAVVSFVALDSTVRIDDQGMVFGLLRDSVGARIVGGVGSLQSSARVFVSVTPELLIPSGATTSAVMTFPPITASSSAADSIVNSVPLSVTVTDASGRAAQGIVVYYRVLTAPESVDPARPTAIITNDVTRLSSRDTTDVRGGASRKVTFNHRRATGALLAGTTTDTVYVAATALYLGLDIAGGPILFKVPVRRQ